MQIIPTRENVRVRPRLVKPWMLVVVAQNVVFSGDGNTPKSIVRLLRLGFDDGFEAFDLESSCGGLGRAISDGLGR